MQPFSKYKIPNRSSVWKLWVHIVASIELVVQMKKSITFTANPVTLTLQNESKNQMPGPVNSNFTVLQGRAAGAWIDALDAHMQSTNETRSSVTTCFSNHWNRCHSSMPTMAQIATHTASQNLASSMVLMEQQMMVEWSKKTNVWCITTTRPKNSPMFQMTPQLVS